MRYAVIIEKGKGNYSAYVPDVPGCVATGRSLEEVKQQMKEALEFHFEGMMLDDEEVPEPETQCCFVDVNLSKIEREVRKTRTTSG